MEDNFSMDLGWGGVGEVDGSGGNTSDGEQWGAADEASLSTATHLLLCGPVPNRLRTGSGLQPRGWEPLL